MQTKTKNLFLVPALIAVLYLLPTGRVKAQTFAILHSFTALSLGTDSDGAYPQAGLVLSGNTLYGTASLGGSPGDEVFPNNLLGSPGYGTVFAVNTDGTGFRILHNFWSIRPFECGQDMDCPCGYICSGGDDQYHCRRTYYCPISDPDPNPYGAYPYAELTISGSTLYGTAAGDGASDFGTVFQVSTNGTGASGYASFINLHGFLDSAAPHAGLILSGGSFYGTASQGGTSGWGRVFALHPFGTGLTNLHSFSFPFYNTNSDGASPSAGLILSGNTLYGTALYGGSSGAGTVFAVNTNGTGFTNLHSFTGNSDGARPQSVLILSDSTLYGTAGQGGASGNGTVFSLRTDGAGFTTLHSFTASTTNASGVSTNSDGAHPQAGLILSGNTLYGTAGQGGASGNGTVFSLKTDGAGFTTLHGFTASSTNASGAYTNSDGAYPHAGLVLSGNTLFGTASSGGSSGSGTVFSLSFWPQLTIAHSGTNAILTWPTNAVGFTLQATANLGSTADWSTNFPAPVVIGDQNTVTNPITGVQKFYRLVQ